MESIRKTLLWNLFILAMAFPMGWSAVKATMCGGLRWVLICATLATLWGAVMGYRLRASG